MSRGYYAVIRGKGITVPTIFETWEECKRSVSGCPGADFKKFLNREDAEKYIQLKTRGTRDDVVIVNNVAYNTRNNVPLTNTSLGIIGRTIVYTDGSSMERGAGYGIVMIKDGVVCNYSGKVPCLKTVIRDAPNIPTNNQAELYAILLAIQNTTGPLTIRSDSEYSIKALTEWCRSWEVNGWKTSKGTDVMNKELIIMILDLIKNRDIFFEHVYSHKGEVYNELADKLAKQGAMLV